MKNPSIVLIPGSKDGGSGVVVGDGKVVTSFHVIRSLKHAPQSNPEVTVIAGDGSYTGHVLRADESHDLCLLDIPELHAPALRLADNAPELGDPVTAVGYEHNRAGVRYLESAGTVEHLNRADDHPITFTSARIAHGVSGGALLNAKGELAGILDMETGASGALPLEWIKELLARTDNDILLSSIPAKTEIDFYNSIDRIHHPAKEQSQSSEEYKRAVHFSHLLAREWASQRPESYFANATLAGWNSSKEESAASLTAARKANQLYPTLAGTERIVALTSDPEDFRQAVSTFKQLFEKFPEERKPYLDSFEDAVVRGLPYEAQIAELAGLVRDKPSSNEALGTAYYHLRDFDNARQSYERFFELSKNEGLKGNYWNQLGELATELGRQEDAASAYRNAASCFKKEEHDELADAAEQLAAQAESRTAGKRPLPRNRLKEALSGDPSPGDTPDRKR